MSDRCQIPINKRKQIGNINIGKKSCENIQNSCWDSNPSFGNIKCYKDNGSNKCQGLKGCDLNIGFDCYSQIWKDAGCTNTPLEYDKTRREMSYSELKKEADTYSQGITRHHYNKCYGNKNIQNKSKFCNKTIDNSCLSQLSPTGDIITCNQCSKFNESDSGIWLFKDGKKTWIPDCQCPAAVKAIGSDKIGSDKIGSDKIINSNICGNDLQISKPIKRYHTKTKKCLKAYSPCNTSEQCCLGRQCRIGDNRCLNENEFNWSNWINKTSRDPTVITKSGNISIPTLPKKPILHWLSNCSPCNLSTNFCAKAKPVSGPSTNKYYIGKPVDEWGCHNITSDMESVYLGKDSGGGLHNGVFIVENPDKVKDQTIWTKPQPTAHWLNDCNQCNLGKNWCSNHSGKINVASKRTICQ